MDTNETLFAGDMIARLRTALPPLRLLLVLASVSISIAILGGLANFAASQSQMNYSHNVVALLNRIDIGHEPSLVQWFSSVQLAAAATLALILGITYAQHNRVDAWYWRLIAFVMLALSIDEAIVIHEMANKAMELIFPATSGLYFAWTIPATIAVILVAIVLLDFMRRIKSRTRVLFAISAAFFVGGAVGMELASGLVIDYWDLVELPSGNFDSPTSAGAFAFASCQVIEEFFEMFGVSIFIFASYEHLLNSFRLKRREDGPISPAGQDR